MGPGVELKALTLLICASLLYTTTSSFCGQTVPALRAGMTLDDLKARFPNARLVRVDMDEFQRIRSGGGLSAARYVSLPVEVAQAEIEDPAVKGPGPATNAPSVTNVVTVTNTVTNVIQQVVPPVYVEPPPGPPVHGPTHGTTATVAAVDDASCHAVVDLLDCDWGGDADVVLFVIIGVVVVAALVVYAVAFLGSAALGAGDYSYWWDLEMRSSFLTGGAESGVMAGIKLSSGIVAANAHAGIAVEGGYLDMDVELDNSPETVKLDGAYVMAGPAIRWVDGLADNPSYFFVELLGGTTEHEEVDVMSVARTGFNLGLGPVFRLGFHIGAMYLGLQLDEGLIREDDNFTTIVGGEVGIRF